MRFNLTTIQILLLFSILFNCSEVKAEQISKPYEFKPGTKAMAEDVNVNFDILFDQLNKIGTIINIDEVTKNMGIGTNSPSKKLDLAGEMQIISSQDQEVLRVIGDNTSTGSLAFFRNKNSNSTAKTIYTQNYGKGNALFAQQYNSGTAVQISQQSNSAEDAIGLNVHVSNSGTGNAIAARFLNGNVGIKTLEPNLTLTVNGSAGGNSAWQNTSDERLKKNIKTIDNALEKVLKLRGVYFHWIDEEKNGEGKQMGLVAQEAINVIPEVVKRNGDYYSIQYAPISGLLIEAVKELKEQNLILKSIICEEFPEKNICK